MAVWIVLCQSHSHAADTFPVPDFSSAADLLPRAYYARFAFIKNPKPESLLSISQILSKSVALRNAAGAKELISSAGSQPPGACV